MTKASWTKAVLLLIVFVLSFPFFSVDRDPSLGDPSARLLEKADYHKITAVRHDAVSKHKAAAVISAALLLFSLLLYTVRGSIKPVVTFRSCIPKRLRRLFLMPIKYTSFFRLRQA
ncbi:hypothetical protein [uncultured Paenibacillus sp.]|uniref:hypothetical protein n=1 Tax=uncultured Paenibacillus sp. TaxID=227322 RepID=UPI0028D791E2|nr:hypothetical protein [uncultured Paenibacillus sp.]